MKTIRTKPIINYTFLQIVPVTLGVLLGLWLNQWNEDRKEKDLAKSALEGIRQEIIQNQARIDSALVYHTSLLAKIKNNPEEAVLNLGITSTLNSAWTAAQRTDVAKHMDYETYLLLAEIYDLQRTYQQLTDAASATMIMSNVMQSPEETSTIAWKRRWRGTFEDWIYFENLLSKNYKEILASLEITMNNQH